MGDRAPLIDRRDLVVWRRIGRSFGSGIAAFALAGAVMGFLLQPLLRFMSADELEGPALLAEMGIVGTYLLVNLRRWPWSLLAGIGPIILAGVLLAADFDLAATRSRANDQRCLALERDMLDAAPRKNDGPALFQAFGCRPQSSLGVMVPPAAAREGPR